jgi:hypothetical protein
MLRRTLAAGLMVAFAFLAAGCGCHRTMTTRQAPPPCCPAPGCPAPAGVVVPPAVSSFTPPPGLPASFGK